MIIWLNGGYAAGKTTLAAELERRLPEAVVFDPEDVGVMLWKWLPRNDDFQDLPSWRELVVAAALSLRRHHARTLIVPMSLLRESYRKEILGALTDAGETVLHVFLESDPDVLRARARSRSPDPDDVADPSSLDWILSRVDAAARAAAVPPPGTLMLRPDRMGPGELADAVSDFLAAGIDERGEEPA